MWDGTVELGTRWLGPAEAARISGVSRQTVHRWIARARLTVQPTDDGPRIDREELARFLVLRSAAAAAGVALDTLSGWLEGENNRGA